MARIRPNSERKNPAIKRTKPIATNPKIELLFQQGLALHQQNRLAQAKLAYEAVLKEKPQHFQALHMLGYIAGQSGDFQGAVDLISKAIDVNPNDATTYSNRGNALLKLKRLDQAVSSFDQAVSINPDFAEAYFDRGVALHELKHFLEAVASYGTAISIKPDYAAAFFNLGHALQELKQPDNAVVSFLKALEINPNFDFLLDTCLHSKMKLCEWGNLADGLAIYESEIASQKKVTTPFAALSLIDRPDLHLMSSKIYTAAKYPQSQALGQIVKRPAVGKIRLGYFSADFHKHATSALMAELFEVHDTSKFEIYGFSFGPNTQDAMRERISKSFYRFMDVNALGDREVAKLSRDLGIDIAIDLKGYTEGCRTGIFAEGCAPIQVNYLGYPGTMGADYMDYVIADKTVIPQASQAYFTEKVAYLPHSYQVNDSQRKISSKVFTKQELGLPEKGFVFCCFNNGYKILPQTFESWVRILKAVEGSVLWLFEDNPTASNNLREEIQTRGLEGNRLVFAKRMELDEHVARHRLADLFIDTLPYNAHTTASDALWAGLPVLTCTGNSFASRVAASLLNAIDMPELIKSTQEEYEAMAIELATNSTRLEAIKNKLEKNRLTKPLFNPTLFAKHIEAAYAEMYWRHQAGQKPEKIDVQTDGLSQA